MSQATSPAPVNINQWSEDESPTAALISISRDELYFPNRVEMSITPIPEEAGYDLFSLGLFLNKLHPTLPAAGYLMTRDDHAAIFDCFGDRIKGGYLMCIRVRDEAIYQECLRSWRGVEPFNTQSKNLLYCTTLITLAQYGALPWLNIDADYFLDMAMEAEARTRAIHVVLMSPTDACLFTFPFDDGDGCGLQGAMFAATNYRPYREYSQEALDAAQRETAGLENLDDFELTPIYCFANNQFKVEDGLIVHDFPAVCANADDAP